MAQPVWVLSVDLQTKTATFQSGMAEAAKSARGAFTDIKSGADEMGRSVGAASGSARQGVMLLGNEFGVHLPRGLITFISSLGPVGAAMEAAFPFVAIVVGATLLLEHLAKMKAAGIELTQEQMKFGTAVEMAFNSLDQKLLQAGIRSDELRNDHLGALSKQLDLIDRQSMAELAQSFGLVAAAADKVMKDLEGHWYTFGSGSDGAKHALEDFKAKYDQLLAQGKQGEAADLLAGTRKSAQKILDLQNAASAKPKSGAGGADFAAEVSKEQALGDLRKMGIGYTEKEVQAQQALVEALNAQVTIQGQIADLKKADDSNAKRTTAGAMSAESANAAKAAAESQARINEQILMADRATADARLTVQRAGIESRLASDLAFSDREMQLQLAANAAQIAVLDKLAKDYPNALKALQEKTAEIQQQGKTREAELTAKATVAQAAKELQDLEQSERQKIEATRQGSEARVAAISAALKTEEGLQLQDTSFYRDLQTQKSEEMRKAAEEQAKLAADAGREMAAQSEKMGELALAAEREHQAMIDSGRRVSAQQRVQEEIESAGQDFALKLTAASQELAALDKSGKDYENKQREIQDRQKQLTQQYENEVTAIKEKAEIERNRKIQSADDRFNTEIASGMTKLLMGHQSFAKTMDQIGNQIVSGMIQNAIKSMLADDMTKERDAAAAARKAYLSGQSMGGPAGFILGPVMAAAAFASVMAFEGGTDSVPGVGRGDTVPAMLTPGEGIVPGGVMDSLRNMARSGDMGGNRYHLQAHFAPTVHALDADGVDTVLDKHADKFQTHFENVVRRMNR